MRRGASMAEQRGRTRGEYRSHPAAAGRNQRVAHRVDPDVNLVQPADGHSVADCIRTDAKLDELPVRDHAVLMLRKLPHQPVNWQLSTVDNAVESCHFGHGPDDGRFGAPEPRLRVTELRVYVKKLRRPSPGRARR